MLCILVVYLFVVLLMVGILLCFVIVDMQVWQQEVVQWGVDVMLFFFLVIIYIFIKMVDGGVQQVVIKWDDFSQVVLICQYLVMIVW